MFTYPKNKCGRLAMHRVRLFSGYEAVNKMNVVPDFMELKV